MITPLNKKVEPGDVFKIQTTEILYEGDIEPSTKFPVTISVNPLKVYKEIRVFLLPQVQEIPFDGEIEVTLTFMTSFPARVVYGHAHHYGPFRVNPDNGGVIIKEEGAGNTINVQIQFNSVNSSGKLYLYLVGQM